MFMHLDELLTLHKHAAAAAAAIVHTFFRFRRLYSHEQFHDALWRVKLSPLFSFSIGKLPQEILEHKTQNISSFTATTTFRKSDGTNEINQFSQTLFIQSGSSIIFG